MLSNSEDELAHLKLVYDKSQDELYKLMETHRQVSCQYKFFLLPISDIFQQPDNGD